MPLFQFKSRERKNADKAVKAAQKDPSKIGEARSLIDHPNLSNSERAKLYKQLSDTPRYRNQRDNKQNPETTCSLTSMAMAFEGLGMDVGDTKKTQGEEALYGDFYKKSRSRIETDDREDFAEEKGLKTSTIDTPNFGSGGEAEKWFKQNILPSFEEGAQATMGIQSGRFRHIVRLQWVDSKGLTIDDPYGKIKVDKDGTFLGYPEKNTTDRDNDGDQKGIGDNNFLNWDAVATLVSNRYVQMYDK